MWLLLLIVEYIHLGLSIILPHCCTSYLNTAVMLIGHIMSCILIEDCFGLRDSVLYLDSTLCSFVRFTMDVVIILKPLAHSHLKLAWCFFFIFAM